MKTLFVILQMASAIALILIVMSQATKSEGLTGTIGGKSESAFQGKPGFEDRLADITKWSAWTFLVVSLVVSIVFKQ